MNKLLSLLAVAALASCYTTGDVDNDHDSNIICCEVDDDDMTIPDDHQMVAAVDPLPGAIFTEIECPDDGAEAAGLDVRRVAQTVVTNDTILMNHIDRLNPSSVNDTGDGGSAGSYESIKINAAPMTFVPFVGASVTVQDVNVGNVIHFFISGQVKMDQFSGVGAAVDYGHIAAFVKDDAGGSGISVYCPGSTRMIDSLGDPVHTVNFNMVVRHVVTADGDTVLDLVGAVEDSADEITLVVHQIDALVANLT